MLSIKNEVNEKKGQKEEQEEENEGLVEEEENKKRIETLKAEMEPIEWKRSSFLMHFLVTVYDQPPVIFTINFPLLVVTTGRMDILHLTFQS